jgi:exonuclease 3'-5' domain-containing protein 1
MSIVSAQTDIVVVDSATTLLSLLDNIIGLAVDPPSLYLDLEGVKLGRHGSISIISLYIAPTKKIYLIDIHRLGKTAFSTTNSSATSLKTIFESPTIPKVFFDIRNDSDALFSHFQISVDGIKDLQLMELASRKGSQNLVAGLAKCIEKESPVSTAAKAEWQRTKEGASRLYDPKKGGRYEIFNERPIRPEIVQYCAQDVALLPGLYNVYNAKLRPPDGGGAFWRVQVREATKDRIKLSQSPGYDGQAESKVCGPWDEWNIEQAMEAWNDEVMFNAQTGDFVLNEDDVWVDPPNEDLDDYEDNDISARDCIGWEEDMMKNGEYF